MDKMDTDYIDVRKLLPDDISDDLKAVIGSLGFKETCDYVDNIKEEIFGAKNDNIYDKRFNVLVFVFTDEKKKNI